MMRRLVAWWFLAYLSAGYATGGGPVTVGPFIDAAQCEQVRAWVAGNWGGRASGRASNMSNMTWCWWDGKP